MTREGSCHGAPVQFCKSHCKSESVCKVGPTALLSEGHDAEINQGSAVSAVIKTALDEHKPLTQTFSLKMETPNYFSQIICCFSLMSKQKHLSSDVK